MAWKFVLKQDGQMVAQGRSPDKKRCLSLSGRYFSEFAGEKFKTMTLELTETKE